MQGFDSLAYIWLAEYQDGTTLKQFDVDGKEYLFSEVDQSKLKRFGWIPIDNSLKPISISLNEKDKLVCYRKNFLSFMTGAQSVVFVLGKIGHPLIWIFADEIVITEENI